MVSQLQFLQCSAGQATACRTKASLSIVSIEPQDKAIQVSVDVSIRISFSEKILSESITMQSSSGACTQSIQLGDSGFENCVGLNLISNTDQTITVKPIASLDINRIYKVKVKSTVFSVSGLKLATDYVHETGFQTAVIGDSTPPITGGTLSFSGVTATGLTVNWPVSVDNATEAANLQYKLVKDDTSISNINTIALANSKSGTDLILDWTNNVLSQSVGSLSASTNYSFTVLVRDSSGNISQYTPAAQTTSAVPDTTAPTTGTAISFNSVLPTKITVQWGAGTDAITLASGLEYKLVKDNVSSSNINTIALANAKIGSDLLMDWSANVLSKTATGLVASTTYHFAVLIRDAAGNMNLYSPSSQMTAVPDVIAPLFLGVTAVNDAGTGSLTILWTQGTDLVSAQADLVYEICYSTTIGVCTGGFTANGGTTSAGVSGWIITGLIDGTYYVVVRCKDESGNISTGLVEMSGITSGCPGPASCS
ncbi:Ig-like domain-containing protein [Leptospira ilyithenensis]|nr:Ig-like domain-containing protein [Leptospira ilyithenensis]